MIDVLHGDCLDLLPTLAAESIDACVTDPPYGLGFMGKQWDRFSAGDIAMRRNPQTDAVNAGMSRQGGRQRACADFQKRQARDMRAFQDWCEEWARELYRVLKPGAHLVAFGGTRTVHRMAVAIEDAGFEIRDSLIWAYGSGFPKSLDVSKAIDKRPGVMRHKEFAADLKAAMAAKGYTNTFDVAERVIGRRTGAVANWQKYQFPEAKWWPALRDLLGMDEDTWGPVIAEAERAKIAGQNGNRLAVAPGQGADRSAIELDITAPATDAARQWAGWGTALKPAFEPIILARKPLSGTVAANVLAHGTGALNIDGCRVAGEEITTHSRGKNTAFPKRPGETSVEQSGRQTRQDLVDAAPRDGRWPPNLLHDGSPEVLEAFGRFGERSAGGNVRPSVPSSKTQTVYGEFADRTCWGSYHDDGTAARFFPALGFAGDDLRWWYGAKADRDDRVSREVEEVTVEWTSELGQSQVRLQADTGQSPAKAIVVSGSGDALEWSTFLCGSTITDLCRRGSRCIIETATSSTIGLKTWSLLIRSLISASTADVKCEMVNGGSHAANAASSALSATITLAETVSLPGASHAASGTRLKISVSARRHGHPTIKPINLMRWLVRLVCPPGGTVIDPFAGSGTTGAACIREGFDAVMIERECEYVSDIRARLAHIEGADTPLFAEKVA